MCAIICFIYVYTYLKERNDEFPKLYFFNIE